MAEIRHQSGITIPVAVHEAMLVSTGDRVEFVEIEPGRYEFMAIARPVSALKGMSGKPAKAVSIRQMNAAIATAGTAAK